MNVDFLLYKYFVYRHVRLDTNQIFYIGIGKKNTNSLINSIKSEYSRAFTKNGRGKNWNLIKNKTDYKVEIVFETNDYQELLNKERELIRLYGREDLKTGLLTNLTSGGQGTNELSPEARAKISKRLLGIKRSEETKNKLRVLYLGTTRLPHLQTTKEKISLKNAGEKNGMYGKHGLDNGRSKPVKQYTLDYTFIKEWVNGRIAGETLNISYKGISECATGRIQSSHGYIWEYTRINKLI